MLLVAGSILGYVFALINQLRDVKPSMEMRHLVKPVIVLDTDQGVKRINLDGTETVILRGPVSSGTISSDGRLFILKESIEGERLHVLDMIYGKENVVPMPDFAKWMGFGPTPLLVSPDGERLYIEKMVHLGDNKYHCQVELFNTADFAQSLGKVDLEDCSNILVGELAPGQLVTVQFTSTAQYHIVLDFDSGRTLHRVEVPGIVSYPSGFRNEEESVLIRAGVTSGSKTIYVLSDWGEKVPAEAVVIPGGTKALEVHPIKVPYGWIVTPSSLQISGDGRNLYLGVAPKERARSGEAHGMMIIDALTFSAKGFLRFGSPILSFQIDADGGDQMLYGIGVRNSGQTVLINASLKDLGQGIYREILIARKPEVILGIVH